MDDMNVSVESMAQAIAMFEQRDVRGLLLNRNDLVRAYQMRGLAYMQTNALDEAFADCDKAFRLMDDMQKRKQSVDENLKGELYALRGMIHATSGDFGSAVPELRRCMDIWNSQRMSGMPINQEMFDTVRGLMAGLSPFTDSSDNHDEVLSHLQGSIASDEALKPQTNHDKSELANKHYFAALNYMQKGANDEAVASHSKCIALFSEIGMPRLADDDKKILSSAYMCRAELYYQDDEDDKALEDYNSAVSVEEHMQKSGVEMVRFDTLDTIRLYAGRARVLAYLDKHESAIGDYVTASRLGKAVFEAFPDTQEEYYTYLDELVDCLIEANAGKSRFNDVAVEFLYPLLRSPMTEEAQELQNEVLTKIQQ